MDERQILEQVQALVEREHHLRERVQSGEIDPQEEQAQLHQVEETLDQCWDLLRQRRARRDAGQSPDEAVVRPVDEVEGYQQ
ncbi:MAG: DUF2630 family protein [Jiangellaceae bacterium]